MKKLKKTGAPLLALCIAVSALFAGCTKKIGRLGYTKEEGGVTITAYKDITAVTSLEIPDEIDGVPVAKIADYAICNSESLKEITVGKNVSEIGSWAFTNNTSLKEFKVSPDNRNFRSVDGVLFTRDMKTLLFFPADKSADNAEYAVPDGVETIRSKAFYKCGGVKSVALPGSLKHIEEMAFYKCSSLGTPVLPEGLRTIGKDAFFGCTGLTEITIPASVVKIDKYAFFSCTKLLSVTVLAREKNMELGERWYPTNNGREMDKLVIEWK